MHLHCALVSMQVSEQPTCLAILLSYIDWR